MVSPNDPTLVVPSKPCQSAQTRKKKKRACAMLIAMAHPSRVLNLDMKAKLCMPKSYI